MDLLWENASPTSSFEPQTIVKDLSNYWGVMIIAFRAVDTYAQSVFFVKKNTGDECSLIFQGSSTINERVVIVSDSGIEFRRCATASYGSSWNTTNSYVIPLLIYGIEGIT